MVTSALVSDVLDTLRRTPLSPLVAKTLKAATCSSANTVMDPLRITAI